MRARLSCERRSKTCSSWSSATRRTMISVRRSTALLRGAGSNFTGCAWSGCSAASRHPPPGRKTESAPLPARGRCRGNPGSYRPRRSAADVTALGRLRSASPRRAFFRLAAENVVERGHYRRGLHARERVEDRLSLAARGHEALTPQHGEMLGKPGLAQSHRLFQLADRFLAVRNLA